MSVNLFNKMWSSLKFGLAASQQLVQEINVLANFHLLPSAVVFVQDLAQYVNEVKRDNETLREIDQYQKSIENLVGHLFFLLLVFFLPR